MWQHFSLPARRLILRAQQISVEENCATIGVPALFIAALEFFDRPGEPMRAALERLGWSIEEAKLYARAALEPRAESEPSAEGDGLKLSPGGAHVVKLSAENAQRMGVPYVEPEHILFACLAPQDDTALLTILAPLGWDEDALRFQWVQGGDPDDDQARHPNHPLSRLTDGAQKAVEAAYAAMRATYCGRIGTAHLLLGLLESDTRARELLEELGVLPDELKAATRAAVRSDGELATPNKRFAPAAKRALDRAKTEAQARGAKFIGTEHILLGLLPRPATVRERLTWGRDVPDEAARVLADVDDARLGELVGQKRTIDDGSVFDAHVMPMWMLGFLSESLLCLAGFGAKVQGENQELAKAIATGAAIVAAFLLWIMFLETKAPTRPRTRRTSMAQNIFIGVLMGFALGLVVGLIHAL